ncbi:hypothetical protein [Methylobacterium sp. PvR107]|uniref:hypothetical protein n=1 Tax=Methylobacterium sp. PvR107 TaxID=2806597 RepID=UPI001AE392FB|nr:hypothetical protein [Methylobacterium sp. PvR107]MBP1181427.1 hypothetical protein [Methylobacterium sp. PvR107]
MAAEPRTLAELRKAGIISSQEVVVAIDAYMLNPSARPYRFASGHILDLAALVNASPVFATVGRSRPLDAGFRTALAAAMMAAHPVAP